MQAVSSRVEHDLSQQGVWVFFWAPKSIKSTPQDTQIFFVRNFLKCQSPAYNFFFSSPYNSHYIV